MTTGKNAIHDLCLFRGIRRGAAVAAVLLLFCLVSAAPAAGVDIWNGEVADSFAGGNGSAESPYEIATAKQLAYLAQEVTNGNVNVMRGHFLLTNDINLNNHPWTPIGYSDSGAQRFLGTFDGGNKTISNLFVHAKSRNVVSEYLGLFGSNSGTIKNLKITGEIKYEYIPSSTSETSCLYIGGIAGFNSKTITHCSTEVVITGDKVGDNVIDHLYLGGITGENSNTGTLSYCHADGSVTGAPSTNYEDIGGIAGINRGTISHCSSTAELVSTLSVGGIVGTNEGGSIEYCWTDCKVTATSQSTFKPYAGGIAGEDNGGNIAYCWTTSTVTATLKPVSLPSSSRPAAAAGGIVGVSQTSYITHCYTVGTVTAESEGYVISVGGIVGENFGSVLSYGYTAGTVTANSNSGSAAGIVGINYYLPDLPDHGITNYYALNDRISLDDGMPMDNSGRIAGIQVSDKKLADNYGWTHMTVMGQTVTSDDTSSLDGADICVESLWKKLPDSWDETVWEAGDDSYSLPKLKGMENAAKNPEHLLTTVTFIAQEEEEQTQVFGDGELIQTPQKTGYRVEWYKSPDFTEEWDVLIDRVHSEDITLYGKYIANQYTLSFDTDGGSAVAPIIQDYGTPIIPPEIPTKAGHTFVQWIPDLPSTIPAINMTFKAEWKKNEAPPSSGDDGGKTPTTEDGKTPTTEDGKTPTTGDGKTPTTGDGKKPTTVVIPVTSPEEPDTPNIGDEDTYHTITFNASGGTGIMNPQNVTKGETVTLSENAFTRDGYTFLGWTLIQGGAVDFTDSAEFTPESDVTLYAVWEENAAVPSGFPLWLLLLICGLLIAAITGGVYLRKRSKNKSGEKSRR